MCSCIGAQRAAAQQAILKPGQSYFNPRDEESIIISSNNQLELRKKDSKLTATYVIRDDQLIVSIPNAGTTRSSTIDIHGNGDLLRLFDQGSVRDFYLAPSQKQAAELACLRHARILFIACEAYAKDHDGSFPRQLDELFPDYEDNFVRFTCPLGPIHNPKGTSKDDLRTFIRQFSDYELFGGSSSDPPTKILLRCRHTTADGRRAVVYVDQKVEMRKD